ncbi:unnamed protein product, partial [Durusdinium trenchii]
MTRALFAIALAIFLLGQLPLPQGLRVVVQTDERNSQAIPAWNPGEALWAALWRMARAILLKKFTAIGGKLPVQTTQVVAMGKLVALSATITWLGKCVGPINVRGEHHVSLVRGETAAEANALAEELRHYLAKVGVAAALQLHATSATSLRTSICRTSRKLEGGAELVQLQQACEAFAEERG